MSRSPLLEQIGWNVDRLVTTDFPSYGVIGPLYRGAVALQGGPLCMRAAEMLKENVAPGDTVILLTGLILPGHYPYGETDGPLGAAVLARALAIGLKARVLVVVEPELTGLMGALLRVAELPFVTLAALETESGLHRPAAAVVGLSRDSATAHADARSWIGSLNAKAVVAIEKAGTNAQGVYHMVGGADISATVGKGDAVFSVAAELGLVRIGIGDRGNELGTGPIAEVTRALLPFGTDCGCPCHGGVADQTPADLAVPAVISNWGAYGVAACLAALHEQPDLLHSASLERRLTETAILNGGVEGMSGRAKLAVDGIGVDTSAAMAELLVEVYRAQSVRDPSPFSTPLIKKQ
ncbi:MAG TPA: glutamate cyclase domain-containing protein [Mesorhizobium sp.]